MGTLQAGCGGPDGQLPSGSAKVMRWATSVWSISGRAVVDGAADFAEQG